MIVEELKKALEGVEDSKMVFIQHVPDAFGSIVVFPNEVAVVVDGQPVPRFYNPEDPELKDLDPSKIIPCVVICAPKIYL